MQSKKRLILEFLQNTVLGLVFYLLYTTDFPVAVCTTTATYANDTAILATHNNHIEAFLRPLQDSFSYMQKYQNKWIIIINRAKFIQVTFTEERHAYQ